MFKIWEVPRELPAVFQDCRDLGVGLGIDFMRFQRSQHIAYRGVELGVGEVEMGVCGMHIGARVIIGPAAAGRPAPTTPLKKCRYPEQGKQGGRKRRGWALSAAA